MRQFRREKTTLKGFSAELELAPFYIALHEHADPDAVGSAYAVFTAYRASGIWAPGGLDRRAKALVNALGIGLVTTVSGVERLLVVDTPDTSQFSPEDIGRPEILLLDHHFVPSGADADVFYTDPAASACSDIVFEMLEAGGKTIDKKQAIALLAGILSDTGRLRRGDAGMLLRVSRLLDASGMRIEEILDWLEPDRDLSEQTAIFKGLERMRHRNEGNFFLCWSEVSSYESSVASSMVAAGADVALVASDRKGQVRVAGRCSQRAVSAGLNLATVFSDISTDFGASSGGHAGAAVLEATGDPEALLNATVAECAAVLSPAK